jgi:transcriptional regulator with XRE-family HTH domain
VAEQTPIHEKLKAIRTELGVTQIHIARALDKSPAWYHGIESGRRKIDAETLRDIAKVLGVTACKFF